MSIKNARVKLRLEFDGTPFCGWQLQPKNESAKSLQGTLEEKVATVLRLARRVVVQGCGRTDSGVHAEEFFCHFDVPTDAIEHCGGLEKFRHKLNNVLPKEVVATHAEFAAPDFHAADDVTLKTYEYRLLLRRAKPVLERGRCWWLPEDPKNFDYDLLEKAVKSFKGDHDFKAFASSGHSAKSTRRELLRVEVTVEKNRSLGGTLVRLRFEGRGFLKQMVRNMVGHSVEVATQKRPLSSILELLSGAARYTRKDAGLCAPPEGLFLVKVQY